MNSSGSSLPLKFEIAEKELFLISLPFCCFLGQSYVAAPTEMFDYLNFLKLLNL